MRYLIDTHVLVWAVEGSRRLSNAMRTVLTAPENDLFVSAIVAWEFSDLRGRKRLPAVADFGVVQDQFSLELLDLPASVWRMADRLPNVHGDPVDRILIAHAIEADLIVVSADSRFPDYPVRLVR